MGATELSAKEKEEAVSLLQSLIRIDTTNPPGNEREAISLVSAECQSMGLDPVIVGATDERPNLVARWTSAESDRASDRPLVLSCHLDVVPAGEQGWTHPPFSGAFEDGCVWGRGAIDMKGFAAMGLAALKQLRKEGIAINRDVIFAAVSDEEAGTQMGSRWLVENHPELLGGEPEYVINEVGGFTVHQKGRRFYPIQVAEKGVAWLRLTMKGTAGHSSLPTQDNPVVHLARAIDAIGSTRLPWHPSEEAKRFISGFAEPEGVVARNLAPLLAHPKLGPILLPLAVPDPSRRNSLEAILRNTANPTRLTTTHPINVIPPEASVEIDGRLAPGQTAEDLIGELRAITDAIPQVRADFEIIEESPATSFSPDTPLFEEIKRGLQESDEGAIVVPSIIQGFTDSQNYASLGATCYGFYPLKLPVEIDFASLFHGVNERIPVEGFHWGISCLASVLKSFLTKPPE
ncbi:MAG: M20/M25/M40 family metallo-hydrolase [Verrucomicrobiota bacterium]